MRRGGGYAERDVSAAGCISAQRTSHRRSGFSPTTQARFCRGAATLAGLALGALIGLILAPILPPVPKAEAATTPVGTTEGKFEVTQRGSAQYTIPIFTPPGTRGLAPNLSLVYDSQAGNGLLGHGWSLGGLSIIHRCAANIHLDGFSGGVNYDANDRFCLDGERLVNVGANEYHTRHETWQRVLAYNASGGADTSHNPAYFYVLGKDGVTLEYGRTPDSRIQSSGSANARVWALNKMIDRVGNYYTITYTQDSANGDYRPARIDYTGNQLQGTSTYNSVVFTYENRTDIPARYEAGFAIRSMQRLTNIKSYASADLAREYRLTYDNLGAAGRSRLTKVQECGSDGVCLPATQFAWQNGVLGFNTAVNTYWSTNKTGDGPIGFADINGDGRLDLWGWSSNGNVYVRLANGDGTFQSSIATYWSNDKTGDAPVGFADINADGRADLYGWSHDGNIYVRMSNGDGTFAPATTFSWFTNKNYRPIGFADVDGDGRADYYGYVGSTLHIKLGNGDGTFGNSTTNSVPGTYCQYGPCNTDIAGLNFADVNADGRSDLVGERDGSISVATGTCATGGQITSGATRSTFVRLSLGNGSLGTEFSVFARYHYSGPSGPCGTTNAPLGDLNTDGNADVFAWLSAGNGAFIAPPTSFFPTTGGSLSPASGLADINGDGKDDYHWWDPSTGKINIRLSDGGNSFPTGFSIDWSTNATESPVGFTDINGDGLADLYGWRNNGNIKVRLATSIKPDLITAVTNGLGAQHGIIYKPLSDPGTHARATSVTYPYRPLNDSTYVVRAVSKSDGLGGLLTTGYFYAANVMHITARQPVGFSWIQRVEPDGSWTNDYYNQAIETSGTLLKSETFVSGGRLVKRITNNWLLGTSTFNRIIPRLGDRTEESWGTDGAIISRTTTTSSYDGYGFPISTVVARLDGRKTTTAITYQHDTVYWLLGLKTRETVTAEAPGFTPQTRTTDSSWYPGSGLMASETVEPDDPALKKLTQYGYDGFGNRSVVQISGSGITTRATQSIYDTTGRFVVKRINALGHSETMSVDAGTGNILQQKGPNGLVTTWTHDGLGRKSTETRPDGTNTATTYAACDASCPVNAVMRIGTSATAKGATWSYTDKLGREVLASSQGFAGAWVYRSTSYDTLGRVTAKSHPYYSGETPQLTTTVYDLLHRPVSVTQPGNRVTTTSYTGLTSAVTNPLGQVATTVRDSEDHVVDTVDALGGHLRSSFDPFGNEVTRTDAGNNTIAMTYDRRGRQIAVNHPDRGNWQYVYNVLDENTRVTDANGQVTTYTYDILGRKTSRTTPNGASNWYYDQAATSIGKLSQVTGNGCSEWHLYDALGREWFVTRSCNGVSDTVTRSYDTASQLDTETYPGGLQVKHVYDGYGNLLELRNAATGASYWTATAVSARGQYTGERFGNGVTNQQHFNSVTGEPTAIITGSFQQFIYTWDSTSNLTWRSSLGSSGYYYESFGYDTLNRLKSVTGPAPKSLTYDATGNLTYKSDVGTYTYPSVGSPRPHAVKATAGAVNVNYTYDANGNLISGRQYIVYNALNQPVTMIGNGQIATLAYDAADQRFKKTVGSTTTYYLGDRYERVTSGASVTHRNFLYAGSRPVALVTTTQSGSTTQTTAAYYHVDHLGSVTAVTDAAGTATRLSYDAFGKRRNANGTDAATPPNTSRRGFTGHEHDDEVGLINMEAREQDPALGRFLSPDPLGTGGDPNPYAYANNSPLKYVDPTGTSFVLSDDFWNTPTSSYSYSQQVINSSQQLYNSIQSYNNALYSGQFSDFSPSVFSSSNSWNSYNSGSSASYNIGNSSLWSGYNSSSVWNNFNSSSSAGLNLWGNTAPTTTNYNTFQSSGVGGTNDPFSSIGAGRASGLPTGTYQPSVAVSTGPTYRAQDLVLLPAAVGFTAGALYGGSAGLSFGLAESAHAFRAGVIGVDALFTVAGIGDAAAAGAVAGGVIGLTVGVAAGVALCYWLC
jgi:RHS repeat-associated protein